MKQLSSSSNKEVTREEEYSGTYVFAVLLVLGAEGHPGPGGFPGGSLIKNPPANAGDMGLIPGLGRSPGEGNGNPFQYSCLENSMYRGAWWATVCGVAKESNMT